MILIRSVVFNTVFYASFVALMLFGSPCLLLPRAASSALVRLWAKVSVRLLATICGTKVEFRNLHLLPKGASIIAVKHQSFLETFALITVVEDFTYILKKELTAIPFFGWYVKATGQIAVDRSKRGASLAGLQRQVGANLAAGRQIIIFPEGTRRPVGVSPVYKSGVSALCEASNVPCTPVALNTGVFWPRRSIIRRPGTVVIEFLPPIFPMESKPEFMRALQSTIESHTNRLVAEALGGDPTLDGSVADDRPAAA